MKISSLSDIEPTCVSHNQKISKQVMISKEEISSITNFSRAVFPPGERAGAHSHDDMAEVFFIASGQGVMIVDGKEFEIHSNTCILIEPLEVHEIKNTGKAELVILYFGVEA